LLHSKISKTTQNPQIGDKLPRAVPAGEEAKGDQGAVPTDIAGTSLKFNPSDSAASQSLVASSYIPTLTQPSVTPATGLTAATTDLSIKSSASAGQGDDSFDELLPKILDELSNLAIQFIEVVFSSVNYISCGVLNFQDFCNATTQLSARLENDVTKYFDGLKAKIKGKTAQVNNIKERLQEVANNYKKPREYQTLAV
jgi:hypothetical protein